jgi:hypothetical protein
MDPQKPVVTIGVECAVDRSAQVVTAQQTRAVYFPAEGLPHVVYLCPGCNDAHRYRVPVDFLDQLRAAGAPSDYPDIPDEPPGDAVPA